MASQSSANWNKYAFHRQSPITILNVTISAEYAKCFHLLRTHSHIRTQIQWLHKADTCFLFGVNINRIDLWLPNLTASGIVQFGSERIDCRTVQMKQSISSNRFHETVCLLHLRLLWKLFTSCCFYNITFRARHFLIRMTHTNTSATCNDKELIKMYIRTFHLKYFNKVMSILQRSILLHIHKNLFN